MQYTPMKIIVVLLLLCLLLSGCSSLNPTSQSSQSTSSSSTDGGGNVTNNFDIGEALRQYTTEMSFTVYNPNGTAYTRFNGGLEAIQYEDPATKGQPKPLETYFLNLAITFQAASFRFMPYYHPDLTYPCYDHEAYYVSQAKMYDTNTGFLVSPDVAIDMDGGRLVILVESTEGEQYLLVGAADTDAEAAEVIAFFEAFISRIWPEWWESYQQSKAT